MKPELQKNTICRLCLKADTNVYKIGNTHYKAFIESLFKLNELNSVPSENHHVCCICVSLLKKTSNFIRLICNAQKLTYDILKTTDTVTKDLLRNIDRHKKGLDLFDLTYVRIIDSIELFHEISLDHGSPIKEKDNIVCIELSDEEIEEPILDGYDLKDNEISDDIEYDPLVLENKICIENNNEDHNKAKPKSKSLKVIKKPIERKAIYKHTSSESESSSASESKRKHKMTDIDYQPDSTSHSEDSDFDTYDDEGKRIKHYRIYPRKCDHCDYEVPKRGVHYHHYLFEHPNIEYPYAAEKNYPCTFCGKLFASFKLRAHEKLLHISEEVKCPDCSKEFPNQARMRQHNLRVHPKKTFTCDYCSKIFKTRTDILRHIRTHTGEKPFKCHICDAGFAHSGNRLIHIRSAHQNIKYVPKKKTQNKKLHKKRYTDDEENGDKERKKKQGKKGKVKRQRKIKENDDSSTKMKQKGKKKSWNRIKHKKNSKKIVDYTTEEDLRPEVGKSNIKKTRDEDSSHCNNTDMNFEIKKQDDELDSDDESLAQKKIKKTLQ